MKTFFDSSAFCKRYIDEPGSEAVDALCGQASELGLSIICVPEILSALNRRVRGGLLPHRQYELAKHHLLEDIRDAAIIDLTPPVISACTNILETSPVRAMDALHMACAMEWKTELFVSAGERQISAARKAGLQTRLV